jgi:hypothetical protein
MSVLRRSILPFLVGVAVFIGQSVATFLGMQAGAHGAEPPWLMPLWYLVFLPSTVFDTLFRAVTGQTPGQVFGPFTADVYLGVGLNAAVWGMVAAIATLVIQRHLTRRCS